jgi:superfamily II DNA or RNA helicase
VGGRSLLFYQQNVSNSACVNQKPNMTLLQQLEEIVVFGQAMQVNTSGGVRWIRKSFDLSEDFWKFYRENKEALREIGVRVSKYKGQWQCDHWSSTAGVFTETRKEEVKSIEHELVPLKYPDMVLEYQITSVQYGVRSMQKHNFHILGHSTGVGKTYISLFIARELGKEVLVVCPKSVCTDWHRAANAVGVDVVGVYGWEWMKLGKTEFGQQTEEKANPRSKAVRGFKWHIPENTIVIFDEIHRAKTMGTLNSLLIRAAIDQHVPFMGLSATIAETPMNFAEIGRACNLHRGGRTYFQFLKAHGVKEGKFGLFFSGSQSALKRIHSHIFPEYGTRLRVQDLGDAFPETTIHAKAFDMENGKKIASEYEELEQRVNEIYESIPAADRAGAILAERIKTRRAIELHKAPGIADIALDLIEEGNSVFIAMNFRESLQFVVDTITKKIGKCGFIVGSQKPEERRGFIDAFQRDDIRCIVGITQACKEGINLQDLNGNHPRHSLISPCESAMDLKQVLGRVHRQGGKSPSFQYIVYAAGVGIEEAICAALDEKLKRIDLLMDGNVDPTITVSPVTTEQ